MTTMEQIEMIIEKLRADKNSDPKELEVFENAYKNLKDFKVERIKECMVASEMCGTLRKKIENSNNVSDNAMLKIIVLGNAAKELKTNAKFALNTTKYRNGV